MRLTPLAVGLLALAVSCQRPVAVGPAWHAQPSGLGIVDLVAGQGPAPRPAQVCVVEALGWIEEGGTRGRLFLDTRRRGYPATFPVGVGRVIRGWDEGIATMRVGGKRLLRVPPALGYSEQEAGSDIPKGATLVFEVELVGLQ